MMDMNF